MPDYFLKQPQFKFKYSSLFIFIATAFVAWGINVFGQIVFPSQNLVPYVIRTTIMLLTNLLFVVVSMQMLKQNGLSAAALGLSFSKKTSLNILLGAFISIISIALIAIVLYMFVPYHFIKGPLNGSSVLRESYSYLLGNSLEELMFRGFLLVLFSQLAGWRAAVLIMALPFGLFHLQGTGLTLQGLNMVATTSAYSFIFSLTFILAQSMWTAISVHVTTNILLHALIGLDGMNRALFAPVFTGTWPKNFDLSLWVTIIGALIIACLLYVAVIRRNKQTLIHPEL